MARHELATPQNHQTPVTIEGVDLLLVHIDDRWHAVEDRCSHAGCAFSTDGALSGSVLICDCHGSEFDVSTGAVLRMPALGPIKTFPVQQRADRLVIEL